MSYHIPVPGPLLGPFYIRPFRRDSHSKLQSYEYMVRFGDGG